VTTVTRFMNEEMGRKRPSPNRGNVPEFFLGGIELENENVSRLAVGPDKTRIRYLLDMSRALVVMMMMMKIIMMMIIIIIILGAEKNI